MEIGETLLNYEFLQVTILLSVRHLAPAYGMYVMLRRKNFALNLGPFFVFSNLQILGMIIQQQKVFKAFADDLCAQLLFGLFFHLGYLITSKQYAQIVYQMTILINLSWSIRQWDPADLALANLAFQYVICLCPLYAIYRSIQHKDIDYLSKWYMFCFSLESTVWIISVAIAEKSLLSIYPPICKFVLLFVQLRIYAELMSRQKIKVE